jgi:hypothetical protein
MSGVFERIKGFRWKSWEKLVFNYRADSPGPWGGWSVGLWSLFNIWSFWQSFLRKHLFRADNPWVQGRRSEINLETYITVRSSGGPGERSAACPRTVRGVLVDSPLGPTGISDSSWLCVFTVGIQTRTVREDIADSKRGTRFLHNG